MKAKAQNVVKEARHWKAHWCWTGKHLSRPWNYYALFRRVVDLAAKPRKAIARISAESRYTLYINGRRVHYGPARSYPDHQSFDTLDLTQFLQAGPNTICAICHQYGVPTFQSVYRDASGFILDGVVELASSQVPLHTPEGWQCRQSSAWRKDVARVSIQLGFQEHFDANLEPADWMTAAFQPKTEDGWHNPWDEGPVGTHPFLEMEPRGVPLLADHIESFKKVLIAFRGENARGYKIAPDVYHIPLGEQRKKESGLLENSAAMLADNDECTVIPPPADGEFVMAVLDLEQQRTGHFMLDIVEAAGDEIIDIIYSEALEKDQSPHLIGTGKAEGCEEAFASRYRCRPGAQRWETFHYYGFRYATLIFRNVEKPLKLRHVAVRQVHAAVEDTGSFTCSDEKLNRIWQVARETQRNCIFDAFVDCPTREQAQWWGDARVQARVTSYAFGDSTLLERGIRQVAQSQTADGALHACPPADINLRLPDYMVTWVGSLWDYYFHTGRTELLRECLPVMNRLFDFFDAHDIKDCLIGNFEGFWVFLDWQNLYKGNVSAVLNMGYLAALRWAAAICQVLTDETNAARYERKAEAVAASCEKYFWDAKAKAWRDGFDVEKDAPVEEISQHTNTLAMLLRLKPETHPAIARDVLLKSAKSKRTKILTASPFFYAYVLEALTESNYRAEVIDIIRDKWGEMIDQGATTFWENWEPGNGSRCHAWSASPLYHLSQQVLGVIPVEVGWKQVRIAPCPTNLDFARGVVPSPLGPIRVEWEKAGEDQLAVRVDLPENMTAEFVGPLGDTRTLEAGAHEFHT